MSNTYFIDHSTLIPASWLNDVNDYVYGTAPSTKDRGTVTASAGQTVFTVPFAYVPGSLDLTVYINGIHQVITSSYAETDTTTVTFTEGVPLNAVVEFVG